MEWWRGGVIYQIYPRSFMDSNGDGIGDLAGITQQLEYVASLGVDGVWLSPFLKSPMKDFGYDVEDYRAVDPTFGTLEDFDRLLGTAHRLGLKVIIDMVLSHTSDRHAWFQESRTSRANPRADWYVWADPRPDGTPPNNWLSVFGGPAWTWDSRRAQYYFHNFLAGQPDLNLHRPAVQDAVLAEAEFWLARGVDGFRLDTTNLYLHDPQLRDNPPRPRDAVATDGVTPANPYGMQWHRYDKSQPENLAFLRRIRALMDRYPDTMTVAEVSDDDSVARSAEYIAAPDLLHTAYGFSLLTDRFGARLIQEVLEHFEAQPGDGWPSWALSNHDVPRVVTRWGRGRTDDRLARALIALLCSIRGTPFLYQGEELGLPEAEVPYEQMKDPYGLAFYPEFKGRDGCRTPMPWHPDDPHGGFTTGTPWLPVPEVHRRRAVARQEADRESVLNFTRSFLRWRRDWPELRLGAIRFVEAPDPVVAFERALGPRRLVAAFNLEEAPARVGLPARARPVPAPGLCGSIAGDAVELPGFGMVFGVVA